MLLVDLQELTMKKDFLPLISRKTIVRVISKYTFQQEQCSSFVMKNYVQNRKRNFNVFRMKNNKALLGLFSLKKTQQQKDRYFAR